MKEIFADIMHAIRNTVLLSRQGVNYEFEPILKVAGSITECARMTTTMLFFNNYVPDSMTSNAKQRVGYSSFG